MEDIKKEIEKLEREILPLFKEHPDLLIEIEGITSSEDLTSDFVLKNVLTAIRRILENIVDHIYQLKYADPPSRKKDLANLIIAIKQKNDSVPLVPENITKNMHRIRDLGNEGPHKGGASPHSVRVGLIYIHPLLSWYSKSILHENLTDTHLAPSPAPVSEFTKLATLNTGFHNIKSIFLDAANHLWVTDNEQLKAFNFLTGKSIF